MAACPHHRSETSATIWGGEHGASPTKETRNGRPSSHAPIRAERPTLNGHAFPLGQDEAVRPRDRCRSRPLRQRPLNRETLSDRLTLLPVPQRTADHTEQTVERGEQDGEADPEEDNARIDDEQLHREIEEAGAGVTTTTRKPVLGPHAARVVERARERDAIMESHFNLTFHVGRVGWLVGMLLLATVMPSHTTSIPFSSSLLPISSIFS